MDNTKAPTSPSSSAKSINWDDYQISKEPQKRDKQSVHEQVHLDMKAIHITPSKALKDVSIHIDVNSLEESERIRKINDMIERSK